MFHLGSFIFRVATDSATRKALHQLRYQIYVTEYGFEKPEDHPHGLERDLYDENAIPLAALDRKGCVVGSLRLILPSPLRLPAMDIADPDHLQDLTRNGRALVEFSRFAISKSLGGASLDFEEEWNSHFFQTGCSAPSVSFPAEPPPARTVVALGLLQLGSQIAHFVGATDYIMTAEKSLSVFLRRHGARWKPMGPEVDFHGKRAAYIISAEEGHPVMTSYRVKLQAGLNRSRPAVPRHPYRVLAERESFLMGGLHFTVAQEEQGWGRLANFSGKDGGGVPDGSDPFAITLGAIDLEGNPAGTIKVSLNSAYGLQTVDCADRVHRPSLEGFLKAAELSPVCLSKDFLDRWESIRASRSIRPGARRRLMLLLLGLFRMVYRISKQLRVTIWLVMLDSVTAQTLKDHGIAVAPIGPAGDGQGRAPFMIQLSEIDHVLHDPRAVRKICMELIGNGNKTPSSIHDFIEYLWSVEMIHGDRMFNALSVG